MTSARTAGRWFGFLLIAQAALAYVVNFVLLATLSPSTGYLANAAGDALRIRIAVLLGLVNGAVRVGVAIVAWDVFRRYSQALALWFVVLCGVGFSLMVLEDVAILTMLSLSQEYVKGSSADFSQAAGLLAKSARHWAHYLNLILAGGAGLVMYAVLLRFALVPRVLAAAGFAAVLLQIVAVTMPIFGQRIVFLLLAPLGVSQLLVSIWLLVKGFATPEIPQTLVR